MLRNTVYKAAETNLLHTLYSQTFNYSSYRPTQYQNPEKKLFLIFKITFAFSNLYNDGYTESIISCEN